MNRVILEGHLGRDPEIRYLSSGQPMATVSLATSNDYKKGEEWVKMPASWHNLVAFGDVATSLAEARRGEKVKVEGKITYRKWEKDGQERTSMEIQVFKAEIANARPQDQPPMPEGDEIPF